MFLGPPPTPPSLSLGSRHIVPLDVRVAIRIRPTLLRFSETPDTAVFEALDHQTVRIPGYRELPPAEPIFDWVFGPSSPQRNVYSTAIQQFVQKVIKGNNSCVIVYGESKSGKTHTMFGSDAMPNPPVVGDGITESSGIVQRSIAELLAHRQQMLRASADAHIYISILQAYNNKFRDLLNTRSSGDVLQTREKGDDLFVPDLLEEPIAKIDDMYRILSSARQLAAKKPHAQYCHTVMIITYTQKRIEEESAVAARLTFIECGDMSAPDKSGLDGELNGHVTYSQNSQIALGEVLQFVNQGSRGMSRRSSVSSAASAVVEGPINRSPFTRLLKHSLLGNSVLLIGHLNPTKRSIEPSYRAVNFCKTILEKRKALPAPPAPPSANPEIAIKCARLERENLELAAEIRVAIAVFGYKLQLQQLFGNDPQFDEKVSALINKLQREQQSKQAAQAHERKVEVEKAVQVMWRARMSSWEEHLQRREMAAENSKEHAFNISQETIEKLHSSQQRVAELQELNEQLSTETNAAVSRAAGLEVRVMDLQRELSQLRSDSDASAKKMEQLARLSEAATERSERTLMEKYMIEADELRQQLEGEIAARKDAERKLHILNLGPAPTAPPTTPSMPGARPPTGPPPPAVLPDWSSVVDWATLGVAAPGTTPALPLSEMPTPPLPPGPPPPWRSRTPSMNSLVSRSSNVAPGIGLPESDEQLVSQVQRMQETRKLTLREQHRERMDQLRDQILEYLSHGTTMVMYALQHKPKEFFVFLSQDLQFLCYTDKSRVTTGGIPKVVDKLPVHLIRAIMLGRHSEVFESFEELEDEYKRSFTIGYDKQGLIDTLDFVADSSIDFEAWMIALSHLAEITPAWGAPLLITDLPGYRQLDAAENRMCAKWHIEPILYLQLKRQLISECQVKGYITPLDIRERGELGMKHPIVLLLVVVGCWLMMVV
eukprot:TRINITY_DN4762_c0_g1_i3.p1 TRINITY_DN4762_c0_g1~~TRINITY_DN4762_c0_g1_i3.p1  ORF type:complete len:944 (+),score=219.78 TRINITY_DN4762_c0_g1_i3:111-2942(+)